MATHSSVLSWEIPWTEEPGGPQSMGSQRVGHSLAAEQQEVAVYHTELNKVLCDNLEEWDGVEGGLEAPEGEGTCMLMVGSLCCMAEADMVS